MTDDELAGHGRRESTAAKSTGKGDIPGMPGRGEQPPEPEQPEAQPDDEDEAQAPAAE